MKTNYRELTVLLCLIGALFGLRFLLNPDPRMRLVDLGMSTVCLVLATRCEKRAKLQRRK
jgi:hypothetical protein